jgi:hypothetical protein
MWKFCTGGVCDLRGALRHAREPRAASYRQRRRSTRVDPSISARRCDNVADDVVWEGLLNGEPDSSLRQVETRKPIAYLIDDTRPEREDAEMALCRGKTKQPFVLVVVRSPFRSCFLGRFAARPPRPGFGCARRRLASQRPRFRSSRRPFPCSRTLTTANCRAVLDLCQESLTSTRTLPEISGFAAMEKASSTSSIGST